MAFAGVMCLLPAGLTSQSITGFSAGAAPCGVFNKIFSPLAATSDSDETLMIDATHLKAHRTAARPIKKGLFPDIAVAPKHVLS